MNGSQRVVNQRTRIRLKLESSDDESEKTEIRSGKVIDSRQLTSSRRGPRSGVGRPRGGLAPDESTCQQRVLPDPPKNETLFTLHGAHTAVLLLREEGWEIRRNEQ
jgi:hypothetical protein